MNYYLEISKKIEKFCNAEPAPDERIQYLETATKIRKLFLDSLVLQENGIEAGEELEQIYEKITKLVD